MESNSTKLYIAMYHYVRDLANSRYPSIKGLDKKYFRQQLEYFKTNFTVVTMEEVIAAWNTKQNSLPQNALLLTFDDGYIDNYVTVFPILKEYNMQGSFFVSGKTFTENTLLDVNKVHFILASGRIEDILKDLFERLDFYRNDLGDLPSKDELFRQYAAANRFDSGETIFVKRILQNVLPENIRNLIASELFKKYVGLPEDIFAGELYMNQDHIRCMKSDGMYIGIHGYDHYWLGKLSRNEMEKDISKSLKVLSEYIDKNNWVMNYPYGSYNDAVIDLIASKGCKLGLTTEVGVADPELHNKYLLPRFDCNDFPPQSINYKHYIKT